MGGPSPASLLYQRIFLSPLHRLPPCGHLPVFGYDVRSNVSRGHGDPASGVQASATVVVDGGLRTWKRTRRLLHAAHLEPSGDHVDEVPLDVEGGVGEGMQDVVLC